MLILLILNNTQYLLRLYEYLLAGCDLKEWSWSEFNLEHERVTPAGGFLWVAPQPAEEEAPGEDRRSDGQDIPGIVTGRKLR